MTVQNTVVVLIIFFKMYFANPDGAPTLGPYKSILNNVEDCKKPSHRYMKDPPIVFQTSINSSGKTIMLSGNFTVLKEIKNEFKIKLKSFRMRDGKWEQNYVFKNIDCHSMVINLISTAAKVKYDRKNCRYFKGSYVFKNLDSNHVIHLWVSTAEYGRRMWRLEVFIPAGTIYCKEFEITIEPVLNH